MTNASGLPCRAGRLYSAASEQRANAIETPTFCPVPERMAPSNRCARVRARGKMAATSRATVLMPCREEDRGPSVRYGPPVRYRPLFDSIGRRWVGIGLSSAARSPSPEGGVSLFAPPPRLPARSQPTVIPSTHANPLARRKPIRLTWKEETKLGEWMVIVQLWRFRCGICLAGKGGERARGEGSQGSEGWPSLRSLARAGLLGSS